LIATLCPAVATVTHAVGRVRASVRRAVDHPAAAGRLRCPCRSSPSAARPRAAHLPGGQPELGPGGNRGVLRGVRRLQRVPGPPHVRARPPPVRLVRAASLARCRHHSRDRCRARSTRWRRCSSFRG
jgi:hypothetical protein